MLVRRLATVFLALAVLGIAGIVYAQSDAGTNKDKSFFDRVDDGLDNLGKTIFGAVLPVDKTKPNDPVASENELRPATAPDGNSLVERRWRSESR